MIRVMSILQTHSNNVAQPEHYLAVLRAIAVINWLGLAVLGSVAWMLGLFTPSFAPSSSHLLLMLFLEAAGANAILSLALIYRGWYLRTPREALNKLRLLATVVCIWEVLHLVGLYEFFGGIFSPFTVVFPVVVLASFFVLPLRTALFVATLVSVAWLVVSLLHWGNVLYPLGAAGDLTLRMPEATASRLLIMGTVMLACLAGGALWRRQMDAALQGHYPLQLIDTRFDCFTPEALAKRMVEEATRSSANAAVSSVVLMSLEGLPEVLAKRGLDAVEERLSQVATAVRSITRHNLDTLAYLGDATFGLLLPTADAAQAEDVMMRIRQALTTELSDNLDHTIRALPSSLPSADHAQELLARTKAD